MIKKKSIAYIILLMMVIAVIISIYILKERKLYEIENRSTLNETEKLTLSPREVAINKYLLDGKATQTQVYNDIEYSLVLYRESDKIDDDKGKSIYNSPDNPPFLRNDAGAILYEENYMIWESEEPLDALDMSNSGFIDINNDGVFEIILIDNSGEKAPGCSINIYSFDGKNVELINPYDVLMHQGVNFKATKLQNCVDISDIDDDGTIEITTEELLYTNDNTEIDQKNVIKKIYKFDGLKYFLWKETIVPRESNA